MSVKPIPSPDTQAFMVELIQLRDRAARLRLFKTMHKLDLAVKEVGWELDENIRLSRRTAESTQKPQDRHV